MMNQKTFLDSMANNFNDITRSTVNSISEELNKANLLTTEVKGVLDAFASQIKQNKKIRKPATNKQICGYHIFLREKRAEVKSDNPTMLPKDITGVVSRTWTKLSDEEKKGFNDRATVAKLAAAKEAEASSCNEEEGSKSDEGNTETEEKPEQELVAQVIKSDPSSKKGADVQTKPPPKKKVTIKKADGEEGVKKKAVSKKAKSLPPPEDDDADEEDIIKVEVEDMDSDIDL